MILVIPSLSLSPSLQQAWLALTHGKCNQARTALKNRNHYHCYLYIEFWLRHQWDSALHGLVSHLPV